MELDDVIVVGAGVSGLTAGLFTARAELSTRLINCGSSILNRNAHLENYPGFPAGIDPRLLLTLIQDQAENAGVKREQSQVQSIKRTESLELRASGTIYKARRVVLTCWADSHIASDLGVDRYQKDGKTFLETDDRGETSHSGLYAAGRIAGVQHQTIVAAGDGARVGLNVVRDLKPNFYHDWVVPEGYFTDRGRSVPEGCEEISDEERRRRSERARKRMIEYLHGAEPGEPVPHPSQVDEAGNENDD